MSWAGACSVADAGATLAEPSSEEDADVNKADLIDALAGRLGSRAAAAAAVEALVDVILREVATGGTVGITGFGTFEKVDRAPRTGRNPRTGEAVPIAGTSSPRFRPGSYFKDVVADPATLPVEGLAGVRGGGSGGDAEPQSAPTVSEGAPTSVRRARSTRPPGRGPAGRPDSPTPRDRRAAESGTPSTVRKTSPETDDAQAREAAVEDVAADPSPAADQKAAAGGRVFASGEDITASMITAKKAQLAKVKNDEKAKKAKKKDKKAAKNTKAAKDKAKGKGKKKSTKK